MVSKSIVRWLTSRETTLIFADFRLQLHVVDAFDIFGGDAEVAQRLLLRGMAEGLHQQRHGRASLVLPVAPGLSQAVAAVIAAQSDRGTPPGWSPPGRSAPSLSG